MTAQVMIVQVMVTQVMTAQAFLRLPPGEGDVNQEFIEGEIMPKMLPRFFHAKLTGAFLTLMEDWSLDLRELCPEWAVVLQRRGQDWVTVPDLVYISYDRLPSHWHEDEACPVPPELAIEIVCVP